MAIRRRGGFETCFALTASLARHLDNAIARARPDAPDRRPRARRGIEGTTGALLD